MRKLITTITSVVLALWSITAFSQVYPTELNFGSPDNQAKNIKLTLSSTVNWSVMTIPGWVNVNKAAGMGPGTISVTVNSANPLYTNNRSEQLIIKTIWGSDITYYYVTINQVASTPVLSVTPPNINVGNNNPSNVSPASFVVDCNTAWGISTTDEWLSVIDLSFQPVSHGYSNYTLKVVATQNASAQERTGVVTFSSGYSANLVTKTLTVTQAAGAGTVTAINETLINPSTFVYPNPSQGVVNISGSFSSANIYNNTGTRIQTITSSEGNSVNLPKGLYYIEVLTTDGNRSNQKVIIE